MALGLCAVTNMSDDSRREIVNRTVFAQQAPSFFIAAAEAVIRSRSDAGSIIGGKSWRTY